MSDSSTIPVFRLKDLTDLYKKRIILHGASSEEPLSVHATRFQMQILEAEPSLTKAKDGKFILLTSIGF